MINAIMGYEEKAQPRIRCVEAGTPDEGAYEMSRMQWLSDLQQDEDKVLMLPVWFYKHETKEV